MILAKHDKRKKGLIQEQSTSTDFQQAAIYEAMDLTFSQKESFEDLEF